MKYGGGSSRVPVQYMVRISDWAKWSPPNRSVSLGLGLRLELGLRLMLGLELELGFMV